MSWLQDNIQKLTRQLYPDGRAFSMPNDGYLAQLHKALGVSEEKAVLDAMSTLYCILPDNPNFTADDALAWEIRLGLVQNPLGILANRMALIKAKLNQPGNNPSKQNYLYLQEQLQNAGFNVYVYENIFPDGMGGFITKTPEQVTGLNIFQIARQLGRRQFGQVQFGGSYNNLVVNNIDEVLDLDFNLGGNFRSTFFIGGAYLGTFANVPLTSKQQFRQIILQYKPVQEAAFLFINYT